MSEPVRIEFPSGEVRWELNGKLHRDGGPADVRPSSYEAWFRHGRQHRLDGPAVEFSDGQTEWWLYGKYVPPYQLDQYLSVPESARELVAQLFSSGTWMSRAVATATRIA